MNKQLTLIALAICFYNFAFGQTEKEYKTEINKVTVFKKGAQIEREASVDLQKGQMILKFTGLSPYIKKGSIRVDGDGSYTILTVQHQNDFLNQLDRRKEITEFKSQIEELKFKIEEEETWVKIIKDKIEFLNSNKNVTGQVESISPETFKTFSSIYNDNIEKLNLDLLKRKRTIAEYKKEMKMLDNQLTSLNNKSDLPSGTILVTVEGKQSVTSKVSLNYLVDNAAWYPSYDIRFIGVDKPLSVNYKGNVRQNTGVDWKDVDLVLSTAKTNISASIPLLSPFYLQFYYPDLSRALDPDLSNALQGQVAGVSTRPVGKSSIQIRGVSSSSGAPEPLYVVDGVTYTQNPSIDPDEIESIDLIKDAASSAVYGSRASNGVIVIKTKSGKGPSSAPAGITYKRVTSNEYTVVNSQTILSNNKTTTMSYRASNLDAEFEYQSIPKLSENVYLVGKISDWYKAELIDGEVNVYLENSYVGKSNINTEQFKDTLDISFGIDNNISIKREKLTEFSANQFIGSNRKEFIAFKLSLRNNKNYPISTMVYDQIPVSTVKGIQVEMLEISNGNLNKLTGKVQWKVDLKPNENKELIIKYAVKYPKEKTVLIE
ncbi:mucoidy inhibitor MuiA family protein [Flammeovirga aprica]|uniref:Mucoidy inhibitor MuiA family protein n=1 Tax=Flammeovirga aprica JL-4 TaxID=694437 RepID=A0A7X9RZQ7_9BACT|nr:mucoidy inhibitor MuiA family protein [Flammeovirga aprica]NME71604.1 mucoidy inhibitor MuiA family protein [Flammeovirga aprica JL-4]